MTIKAAFFDIDGTLFSHKSGHVPPSTEKAIALLRENGIITAICTGRHDQQAQQEQKNFFHDDIPPHGMS